ncbi:MAG TPA: hypothetical protein VNT92_08510, partial [Acidimicrobiia bacterium]|nr:hypothetical protein [Acidimicrobiia bacterium]
EIVVFTIRRWMVRNFELLSVVVMSLTAILTAWSGFQSAQWSAVQAGSYGDAANDQTESVRASNEARQATAIDLAVFLAWLDAQTSDDLATADFIYGGFPERLRVATDAWLAEDPFENPEAPASPFIMEEYVVPPADVAEELAQTAEEHTIAAQQATERANDYVLTTVLFATVLFFASISSKLTDSGNQWVMLSIAAIGLIAGVVVLVVLARAR